jgi:transcriptional regulator with XRE-family HTH domain
MLPPMNGISVGVRVRALRMHKRLRQEDVARLAGVSRSLVSKVERGELQNVQCGGEVERIVSALGGSLDVRVRWHGEQLDRLLDETHARIVDIVVGLLRSAGWEIVVEASFSRWGERGSIDVLAYHEATRILLVVEVKSVVPDSQAMLYDLDRKTRLARHVAQDKGWGVGQVSRLLVIGDSATSRRRVERLASTFDTAFPLRGWPVRRWISKPAGRISGLLFLSYAPPGSARRTGPGRERVRKGSAGLRGKEMRATAPDGGA